MKIGLERALSRGIEGEECLVDWPIVGAEEVHEVLWRAIPEDECAIVDGDRPGLAREHVLEPGLAAPLGRRAHACGRRDMLANGLGQVADEPLWRPVGHADPAARAADAK